MGVEAFDGDRSEQGDPGVYEGRKVRPHDFFSRVRRLTCVQSYFFSASGDAVKIYSTTTGQVVSTLTPSEASRPATAIGYGRAVTSMMLSPHNPFQLLTGSMDGCIRLWVFVDAVLLRTIDLAQPILFITAHERFKDEVCVTVQKGEKKTSHSGMSFRPVTIEFLRRAYNLARNTNW